MSTSAPLNSTATPNVLRETSEVLEGQIRMNFSNHDLVKLRLVSTKSNKEVFDTFTIVDRGQPLKLLTPKRLKGHRAENSETAQVFGVDAANDPDRDTSVAVGSDGAYLIADMVCVPQLNHAVVALNARAEERAELHAILHHAVNELCSALIAHVLPDFETPVVRDWISSGVVSPDDVKLMRDDLRWTAATLNNMTSILFAIRMDVNRAVAHKRDASASLGFTREQCASLMSSLPRGAAADVPGLQSAVREVLAKHATEASQYLTAVPVPPPTTGDVADDPMALLMAAKDTKKTGEQLDEAWKFAYPKSSTTVNDAVLKQVIGAAAQEVASEIATAMESKGALLLAVQAGMGIGKSHVCDTIHNYVFEDENPLVLKVTYNMRQVLETEAGLGNVGPALLARLVLAAEHRVSPDAYAIVQDVLVVNNRAPIDRRLTSEAVARHVLAKAEGRPIIVAVDEIAALSQNTNVLRTLLSVIASFIKCLYTESDETVKAIGLVTALPHTNLYSMSDRPPKIVAPLALTGREAEALLRARLKGIAVPDRHVKQMLLVCGGHPRSLALVADLYLTHKNTVPLPTVLAEKCMWQSYNLGAFANKVAEALGDAYLRGDIRVQPGAMEELQAKAMLMKTGNGRYAIPPTVLFAARDEPVLDHVQHMFGGSFGVSNSLLLEHINYHWEFFKAQRGLPVVPPTMEVLWRFTTVKDKVVERREFDPSQLRFCFSPNDKMVRGENVLASCGVATGFAKVDTCAYYLPSSTVHRAFESMCVAEARGADGAASQVLCLFQSKINDDVKGAVEKLNRAADDLVDNEVWKGRFLYVVFALGASETQIRHARATASHPLLLVNEGTLANYFTATMAPAAELCLLRHRSSRT